MTGRLALFAISTLLLVPGCGAATTEAGSSEPLDGLTAAQVLKKARAAVKSASSVHFVAHIVESGDDPIDVDVHISGRDAAGTIGLNGSSMKVRLVGQSIYIQGDHQFWVDAAGTEAAKLLDGKWVKGSGSDPIVKSFSKFVSLDSVTVGLLGHDRKVERVKGRTIDGQQTVGLHDLTEPENGTFYVANAEKPYPLLVVPDAGSDSQGRAVFSDWDEKVTVSPPPEAQVVDFDKVAA
jgi:hypothetical protein